MYTVTRSGASMAEAIRSVRDVPTGVIPYAAAAALTKVAKLAQAALVERMKAVFDRPVAYTLNALRVEPATRDKLSARVAVKDQGGRVPQENYLLPEVEGGKRREKGIERGLRYAGILRAGEWVVPGHDAPLDAAGNLSGATVRAILRTVAAAPAATGGKRRKAAAARGYFFAALGRKRTRGIWLRDGRSVKSILIFVTRPPAYRPRLDFVGTAEKLVEAEFPRLFAEAAEAIVLRNPR